MACSRSSTASSSCCACRIRWATTPSGSTAGSTTRSEEHTSELQSHLKLVCRLLLEKKKAEALTSPMCLGRHDSHVVSLLGVGLVAWHSQLLQKRPRDLLVAPHERSDAGTASASAPD